MAVFWGTNYSIVKNVFREIDPQAFNALRMSIASLIFLDRHSWCPCACIGRRTATTAGSVFYTPATMTAPRLVGARGARRRRSLQLSGTCFMAGLSRTSVANSSLMLGVTPVLVALLSAMLGIERIGKLHWVGAALSMTGIYLVVGTGFFARVARRNGRSADDRGRLLLGDLHDRRGPADDSPLAGGGDRHLDDDGHADVPAAGVAQPARACAGARSPVQRGPR